METPGDRELRRRKREAERGQIRSLRRRSITLFGMCGAIVLLTYGRDWLALVVMGATMALFGWMFVKNKQAGCRALGTAARRVARAGIAPMRALSNAWCRTRLTLQILSGIAARTTK
jgi:hypothetical protein